MNQTPLGYTTTEICNNTIPRAESASLDSSKDTKVYYSPHHSVNFFGPASQNEIPVPFSLPHLAVHSIPSLMYAPGVMHPAIVHVGHTGSPPIYSPFASPSFPGTNMPPFFSNVYSTAPPPPPTHLNCYPHFVPIYPHGAPVGLHHSPQFVTDKSEKMEINPLGTSTASETVPTLDKEGSVCSSTMESALITPPAHDHLNNHAMTLKFDRGPVSETLSHNSVSHLPLQVDVDVAHEKSWRNATPNKNFRLPTSPPLDNASFRSGKQEKNEHGTQNHNIHGQSSSNKDFISPSEMRPLTAPVTSLDSGTAPGSKIGQSSVFHRGDTLPDILSPVSQSYSDLPPELLVSRMMVPQQPTSEKFFSTPLQEVTSHSNELQNSDNPCQFDANVAQKVYCHPGDHGLNTSADVLNSTITRPRRRSSRGVSCKRSWLDQNKIYQDKLHARGFRVLEGTNGSKVCSVCHQHFAKEMFVWRHALQHIAQKPFHCNVCGQRFTRSDTLQRHMRRSGHFTENLE